MKKVLVILGPTASGKSDLAVRLAKKFKGEIISADSRQVYKGLDKGTGKITKAEMRRVPHHLLDVADPKKQFSVHKYKELAENSLRYIAMKDKLPIVVGGTGFYIDALAGKIPLPDVPADRKLREKLSKKSTEFLFKLLRQKDPRRARSIDPHNKVKIVRALEIVEALGKVPLLRQGFAGQASHKFIYIGLRPEDLDKRIEARLKQRLNGIINEARKLIKLRKLTYKRMQELGLEYRYVALYLKGKISKDELFKQLNTAIHQYAKRQMTWFRRNKKIKWFEPQEYRSVEKYIEQKLGGR